MGLKLNSGPVTDELSYEYYDNSNKFKGIDKHSHQIGQEVGDFVDKNKTGNDYGYDVNGNMIIDLNKRLIGSTVNIDLPDGSGAIQYNH